MVGSNDQVLFTINKDLQPSKSNNNILIQQWPTNVEGIAWSTMHATVCPHNFYSYSKWMDEKGRHIKNINNAIKTIYLDKLEILR